MARFQRDANGPLERISREWLLAAHYQGAGGTKRTERLFLCLVAGQPRPILPSILALKAVALFWRICMQAQSGLRKSIDFQMSRDLTVVLCTGMLQIGRASCRERVYMWVGVGAW